MTESPATPFRVGVIGGGQLARMMGDEAASVHVELTVLATNADDSAVATANAVVLGDACDEDALRALVEQVDVVTFDHELVDLALLARLEADGVVIRPSPGALQYSVDKAFQRRAFRGAGLPVPRFVCVDDDEAALAAFLDELGAPPVVKAATGGYDGRGVLFPATRDETLRLVDELRRTVDVVVEERLTLLGEVAQMVARGVDGTVVTYPLVDTLQRDGMCVETRFPSTAEDAYGGEASRLSRTIAEQIGLVGVMAVEFFLTDRGLIINELALRPHNSGHWSIEGCATSQFANHLRAVSGQSLGPGTPRATHAVMVNVVGGEQPGSIDAASAVEGVHVHDYGKSWRPGRKLGHVTAVGDDGEVLHVRTWNSARAYGTTTQEAS